MSHKDVLRVTLPGSNQELVIQTSHLDTVIMSHPFNVIVMSLYRKKGQRNMSCTDVLEGGEDP